MTERAPKPKHLGPDYGSQWQDAEMARVYPCRPPYPDETYEVLASLLAEIGGEQKGPGGHL